MLLIGGQGDINSLNLLLLHTCMLLQYIFNFDTGDFSHTNILIFIATGWTLKTKTTFLCDSPIFVLGRCYHRRPEGKCVLCVLG